MERIFRHPVELTAAELDDVTGGFGHHFSFNFAILEHHPSSAVAAAPMAHFSSGNGSGNGNFTNGNGTGNNIGNV